jgi:hypothetical protein
LRDTQEQAEGHGDEPEDIAAAIAAHLKAALAAIEAATEELEGLKAAPGRDAAA